jgi:hypothetical protein
VHRDIRGGFSDGRAHFDVAQTHHEPARFAGCLKLSTFCDAVTSAAATVDSGAIDSRRRRSGS